MELIGVGKHSLIGRKTSNYMYIRFKSSYFRSLTYNVLSPFENRTNNDIKVRESHGPYVICQVFINDFLTYSFSYLS